MASTPFQCIILLAVFLVPALCLPAGDPEIAAPVVVPEEGSFIFPFSVDINVCKGETLICLTETVGQRCELNITEGKFQLTGNPFKCDSNQICSSLGEDGCLKVDPFVCKTVGLFADPITCSKYHSCTYGTNTQTHTTYTCPSGQLYSCASRKCVVASLVPDGCAACRQ